jgi:hypothetical protein
LPRPRVPEPGCARSRVRVEYEDVQDLIPLFVNARYLSLSNVLNFDAEKRSRLAKLKELEELSLYTSNLENVDKHKLNDFHETLKSWRRLDLRSFLFARHDSVPSTPCPSCSFTKLVLYGSLFTDQELEWLTSASNLLQKFVYVQLRLKGAERDFGAMIARMAGMFGGPAVAPPPPKVVPKATPRGLVALVGAHGSQLRQLYLGVEDLKPQDVAQLLSSTSQLEALAIPVISLDDTTTASAPPTLRTLSSTSSPRARWSPKRLRGSPSVAWL